MSSEMILSLSNYISSQILKQPKRVILPDEKIISSGLIDSFHLVDLSMFVEDTYGVRIDDTELTANCFDTLTQLAVLISQRQ